MCFLLGKVKNYLKNKTKHKELKKLLSAIIARSL